MNKFFAVLASIGICVCGCQKQDKPLVVVLLGSPGAGKGTQAIELSKKIKLPHISTGDLFREHLSKKTDLGKKIKEYMDSGNLVPDELVLGMLFERIKNPDCKNGYILDGFPRTLPQAIALDEHLKDSVRFVVINIDVADQTIIDRLAGRLVCSCGATYHKKYNPPKVDSKCDLCGKDLIQRKDDSKEIVQERLAVYHRQTEPLIEYYQKQGKLKQVNGEVGKDQVFEEIVKVVQN